MEQNKLNIKETYSLILSNLETKYLNVLNENYLLKLDKEKNINDFKLNIIDREEIKKDIKENIQEYAMYDLPYYFPQESSDNKEFTNRYNQYILMETHKQDVINNYYYENYFYGKENGKYFKYIIQSDESLFKELNLILKEEEIDILYDYKKEEVTEEEFQKNFKYFLNDSTLSFFKNMGLSLSISNDKFNIELDKEFENKLNNSILNYLFEKNKTNILNELKFDNPNLEEKKYLEIFKNEYNSLKDNELSNKINNEFTYLKNIYLNILYYDLDKNSLDDIKGFLKDSISDFNGFITNNKEKIINSFNMILIENTKNFDNKIFSDVKFKIDNIKSNDYNISYNTILNELLNDEDKEWYKIKCFLLEDFLSKESFFNDLKNNGLDNFLNNSISKRINDKLYSINLENKTIFWSFLDKEMEETHRKEQKEKFEKLKQHYINENPNISREELKLRVGTIDNGFLEVNTFLNETKLNEYNEKNSKLNLLKNVLETNISFFKNNLIYLLTKEYNLSLNELNTLNKQQENKFKNHVDIFNSILEKYNVLDKDKIELYDLIYKKDLEFNDFDLINSLLLDVSNDKVEKYKNILNEYFLEINKNLFNELSMLSKDFKEDSISLENNVFSDYYMFRKLMSIIKDFNAKNIVYDTNIIFENNNQYVFKNTVNMSDLFNLDTDHKFDNNFDLNISNDLDDFFGCVDDNIINNIQETNDFIEEHDENKNIEDDLDLISF